MKVKRPVRNLVIPCILVIPIFIHHYLEQQGGIDNYKEWPEIRNEKQRLNENETYRKLMKIVIILN